MLKKSKGILVASVLSLAAAGGSVAVIRAASPGPENAASAALPVPIGSVVTARVPSAAGAGSVDGAGASGATATATPAGTGTGTTSGGNGQAESGQRGQADLGLAGGPTAAGQARRAPAVAVAAGQGEQGPLAAGALPADGAVPGALASLRALAAARAATTALPHSPRLLNELAGPAGWAGNKPAPAPAVPAASAGATMRGLDVAAYQHPVTSQYPHGVPIDWPQAAAAGYRFAAIKGTEGDYYVNPWAATDLSEAKAAGLDVTPYHFAIPNASSGRQQAEFAVEYSGYKPAPQTLPLMLDIEYDPYVPSDHTNECYGLSASRETAWISAFVTTVRSLTGQYPIIYTTANWWDTCTGGSTAFGDDPMWVAAYGFSTPPLPAGWRDWSFWQYTSGGTVPGVDSPGTTDLDLFAPTAIGLINPGAMASRPQTRVSGPSRLARRADRRAADLDGGRTAARRPGEPARRAQRDDRQRPGSSFGALTYRASVTATNAAGASSTVTFDWQVAASCPAHLTLGVCPQK